MIGYEKPIIYLGGEYIGYRVKDNEKLAPDDNELCPVTFYFCFTINYEQAKAFRNANGQYLRQSQWEDITVEVIF